MFAPTLLRSKQVAIVNAGGLLSRESIVVIVAQKALNEGCSAWNQAISQGITSSDI